MLDIQTILCPTDLSEASLQALPMATRFAQTCGADLHLLNIHLLHSVSGADENVPFPGEAEAREALEASAGGIKWNQVVHRVERGINAAPAILSYAEEHGIDLIVMGSHGRRGFRRLVLGSVTAEVVRHASVPVLVVRHEAGTEPPREIDRIIVPVDFSSPTGRVLEVASGLASSFGVPMDIVHAVEPIPYVQMSYPVAIDHEEFKTHAQRQLEEVAAGVEYAGKVRTHTLIGLADQVIMEAAADTPAPLVVMSSHGRGGLARALLGSTTERMLRHAPCPVLVMRAEIAPED